MRKKYFLLLGIFFVSIGCIKEKITSYNAVIKNTTMHQVKITPFSNGFIKTGSIIDLEAGSSILVAKGFDRGIVNHGGFSSDYFSNADSIVVLFDNTHKIVHYFKTPAMPADKFYIYTSLRNLLNYLSWDYSYKDASKNKREANYIYSIIEQDYIDAKK